MDALKKKLINFWYHYKIPAIVTVVLIAVLIPTFTRTDEQEPIDLQVAVISSDSYSDAQIEALRAAFSSRFGNVNIIEYTVSLGAINQNEITLSRLDLDLSNKLSSVLLLQDAVTFQDLVGEDIRISSPVKVKTIGFLSGIGFDDLWLVTRK